MLIYRRFCLNRKRLLLCNPLNNVLLDKSVYAGELSQSERWYRELSAFGIAIGIKSIQKHMDFLNTGLAIAPKSRCRFRDGTQTYLVQIHARNSPL